MSDREMIVYCGMANCEHNVKRVPPYSGSLMGSKSVDVCGSDGIYVGPDVSKGGMPKCWNYETKEAPDEM